MNDVGHEQIWQAIDEVARRKGMSISGLARASGLDATAFNFSKRVSKADPPRPRWPSTESLLKVLDTAGVTLGEFAALAEGMAPPKPRTVPLIGMAQAGSEGFFDDAGYPVGQGWDEIDMPGDALEGCYALEINGDSMDPLYREGDRILIDPNLGNFRRGDRVVVKTREGEVMAKEIARITVNSLRLRSINSEYEDREFDRADLEWMARIVWASQ